MMDTRWSRLKALPLRERRLLLRLAVLQPAISMGLRLFGYRRTRAWLENRSNGSLTKYATAEDLADAQQLAALSSIAGRHGPMQTTCLRQALAVWVLLRRQGLRPELKLGVDRQGDIPDMHAWVELSGVPLGQPQLRHQPFVATRVDPSKRKAHQDQAQGNAAFVITPAADAPENVQGHDP